MKQKNVIFYYIFLSALAAILLLILIFFGPTDPNLINFSDRLLIGFIFIICCILGISLALFPGWYKKILKTRKKANINKKNVSKNLPKRKGHHPDCDEFENHVIKINNKTICTGCLGLLMGCIISILLVFLYIVIAEWVASNMFFILFLLGLILIVFNFIEIMFPIRQKNIHIFSNILIIIGFLMIYISVFEITGSITFAILGLIMSFLWLDTRVQLSCYRHTTICSNCKKNCKMY